MGKNSLQKHGELEGMLKAGLETLAGLCKEGQEGKDKGSDSAMRTARQGILHGRGKVAFLAWSFLWPDEGNWLSSKSERQKI